MEIAEIINKVRFVKSDKGSIRSPSLCESIDTSIISETGSTTGSVYSCLESVSSDAQATSEPNIEHKGPCKQPKQIRDDGNSQHASRSPPRRRQAKTTSKTCWHPTPQWLHQQSQHGVPFPYGQVTEPVYYPAYMIMPIHTHPAKPPGSHLDASSPVPTQHHQSAQPQRIARPADTSSLQSPPRGVKLPPVPQVLRRSQPTHKSKADKKKKRVRAPPAVHEYDHLSVNEALEELARRNIHMDATQKFDAASKSDLIRLLQRADRNNNKGDGGKGVCIRGRGAAEAEESLVA